ncbi:MAG: hypothetical protein P1P88_21160, partial [Bacteroidales bacterium]|nr:hypothetical protein [Bacteroidales bacterium]
GTKQKVLIELQKSKFETDIRRFRAYLGASYIKPDIGKTLDGKETKSSYPIITIYILGYKVEDIPYMAVTVNHQIINSVNKEPVNLNSDFIRQLNHKSHILQVRRLPDERKSRLEQFMVLFNQAWCTEYKYILDLHDIPKEFEEMARHLQKPVMDEDFRRQLEGEEEIDEIFDKQEAKYLKQIEEAKQKEKEARQNAEEQQLQNMLIIKNLHNSGMPLEKIAEITRKSFQEIKRIIDL